MIPDVSAPLSPGDVAELIAALRSTVDPGTWRRAAAGIRRHPVVLVDCERLAAEHGLRDWRDDRYWFAARQAVSLTVLPALARATAAALAADQGLSRRCVVVDLDNTLWDGVVGEDGIDGVALTAAPRGEAFAAFQEYLSRTRSLDLRFAQPVFPGDDLTVRPGSPLPGRMTMEAWSRGQAATGLLEVRARFGYSAASAHLRLRAFVRPAIQGPSRDVLLGQRTDMTNGPTSAIGAVAPEAVAAAVVRWVLDNHPAADILEPDRLTVEAF